MLCLGVGEFMVRIPAIVTCTAAPRHGFCRWLQWEFPRSKEIPPGEGAKMTYDYLSSCRAPRTCLQSKLWLEGEHQGKGIHPDSLVPPPSQAKNKVVCVSSPESKHSPLGTGSGFSFI